ncbi:MAG: hypothetical protein QG673_2040 [Pseudomonadota bacterium]|nr:hypothetical protein [Pseudomonadota bacterium]
MYIVNIAVDAPLYQLFSYQCEQNLEFGTRVLVPFGMRKIVGFVWESIYSHAEYTGELKSVLKVFPEQISQDVRDLIQFAANYYHFPIGQTVFSAIPTKWRKNQAIIDTNQAIPDGVGCDRRESNNGIVAISLNLEQQNVVDAISGKFGSYAPNILYGITGSGKTEVYLALIDKIISNKLNKQQVLVLVPEINLTPQLLERFQSRFAAANIGILTSRVSEKKRQDSYVKAGSGEIQIIIGTRLAVFTPFKCLGLIIVDEEHDQSFKQQEGLHYHARDLAVWRAQYAKVPIVLGSATPSLETLYNYKMGKFNLYKLSNRAATNAILPAIKLIDLNAHKITDGLTEVVLTEIATRISRSELSMVFINRRGHSPAITCYQCGWVGKCNNCSANLVYHSNSKELKCHYCGVKYAVPTACKSCNSQHLYGVGQGTQKIEQLLLERFPGVRIFRIDQDTLTLKSSWSKLYSKIKRNEVDILVGTQILVKGHDFPNLTLVVGLNIDNALYGYDFRSSESLYTQLTQVAGRAGRGDKPGTVLLQTNYPRHELYQYLINNDFGGFVNFTLKERKLLNLPPYSHYVMLRASGSEYKRVIKYLSLVKVYMDKTAPPDVNIYPPVSSVLQRLKNRERAQMLLYSCNRPLLHQFLNEVAHVLSTQIKPTHGVTWQLDVDPFEF